MGSNGDLFSSRFGEGLLDPVAIYETYSQFVLGNVFAQPRIERLAYQKTVNGSLPGVEDVVSEIYNSLFDSTMAQSSICESNSLEVASVQLTFVNAVLKISSSKLQFSSIAQQSVYAAKYFMQEQLLILSRQSVDSFCMDVDPSCTECLENAKSYRNHVQFILNKVLASAEFLADLPVPLGPPM